MYCWANKKGKSKGVEKWEEKEVGEAAWDGEGREGQEKDE